MVKVIDFATYKMLRNLSFNDTNRWVHAIYAQAYDDGKNDLLDKCVASLTEEHLMEIILSVKGIGKNRAKEVVDKILSEGISYGIET